MPTYDYRCPSCKVITPIIRSIYADPNYNPPCPTCDKPMARIVSVPALSFKGTGWGKDNPPRKR